MRALAFLLLACAAMAVSCTGVQADTGDNAYLQIPGATFYRGPMPQGSSSGPSVLQIVLTNSNIWPGRTNDPVSGALGPAATAVALGLQGDVGYWIVPAGVPSEVTPTDPSFSANMVFSNGIVPGDYTLVARAVDEAGNFGQPKTQLLVASDSPLNPPATGDLVVTLTWDTESNLSLHVVDPSGTEIYWGNQSTEPPPPATAVDGGSYGYIDYDSNANCVIDGLRREDAIWKLPPPPGQYTVRVDTPSLCGQPDANWNVVVILEGKEIDHASGVALDPDTWGNHGTGAGVLALQFTVP
jgi:hypothetical protein